MHLLNARPNGVLQALATLSYTNEVNCSPDAFGKTRSGPVCARSMRRTWKDREDGSGVIQATTRACIFILLLGALQAVQAQSSPRYLSDLIWTSAVNASGPVERDQSNGGPDSGDGVPLTLNGQVFARGLGVHAGSDVRFNLAGVCSTFTAAVGVDDEVGSNGSIVFQVFADGSKIFDSGVMSGSSATQMLNLDVSGRNELALVITDAGNGIANDHGDWADAQINCGSAGMPQSPIVLDGQSNITVSGVSIQNPNGPCIIVINGSQNIRIENSTLGPCLGGIQVQDSSNITIDNVYIHDSGQSGSGVDVIFSSNVNITGSRFERVRTGIYALGSTGIKVERNTFLNIAGPLPRGQYVQFNHVYGRGNRISCNVGESVLGRSEVAEAINIFDSFGEPDDPILISSNKIQGGGPSRFGGGILLGDNGGAWQVARDNIIVNPGQQGIGVAGGNNISVLGNSIYARQQPFTNVGLYVWNQHTSPCSSITVQGNSVNWTASNGETNPSWDAENCGTIAGWSSNNFDAAIDARLLNQPTACSTVALRFVPITPCRIADTRNVAGPFGGPVLSAAETRDFPVRSSACGIPASAQAYALNVTVVPTGPLGYLTIWPAGQVQPTVSTLNSLDGRIKANAAIVPAGPDGGVSVFVSNSTHVILDINGYFVPATDPAGLAFYPLTPCRIADTRNPAGVFGGPVFSAGQTRSFPVLSSACSVPSQATAYSLNMTAVPQGPLGFLTTAPTGIPLPLVSTLNSLTGTIAANAAIVPAGTGGSIDVFATNATDVIIDINGYFAPPGAGGLSLYNLIPCRVLDTRTPAGAPAVSGVRSVLVAGGSCPAPVSARAFSLNATAVPQTSSLGYLTMWSDGAPQPLVSTLNSIDGTIVSNAAIVPSTNGLIDLFASDTTHLVLDISGYFAP